MFPENTMNIPAAFERNETVRIEAFSDGVLTIAITLLVLGITVSKAHELGANGSFSSTLIKMQPHYLPFVTSFITILAKWVNHHRIFSFIQRTDHLFLCWNGILLLFITFFAIKGWPTLKPATRFSLVIPAQAETMTRSSFPDS